MQTVTRLLGRAYWRLGPRYLTRALFLQQQTLYPILVLAVAGASLYVDMSLGQFVRLALLACALQLLLSLLTLPVERNLTRPVRGWLEGERGEEQTIAAWRAAASLPWQVLRHQLFSPTLGVVVWSLYVVWCADLAAELDLSFASTLEVYLAVAVVVSYATALRFFGVEQIVRPVLEHIGAALPEDAKPTAQGLPLRARLIAALPAINVITAVVAYGVARGGNAHAADLAKVVGIAIVVAGTVSLVLTVLLAGSVTEPIEQLRAATRRVMLGEFDTRVPVVTTDETGELARSFNDMASGLAERERIRTIFGTYVDRDVAEYILRHGPSLEGEEVEVTVMFIDVRGFTAYAERSTAPEVVAKLNKLFATVVPLIEQHGGHVDKFVGDGLLAVFGAPVRHDDHADRALEAALAIADAIADPVGDALQIGVGLNSGQVVAGNIGSTDRVEFSVIGDPVNVAARVEAATRDTGDQILISEHVHRRLQRCRVEFDQRTDVALKGKRAPVTLFAPRHGPLGDAKGGPSINEGA